MRKKTNSNSTSLHIQKVIRNELKKAKLDTVADKIDRIDEAVRIIKENEQNLKKMSLLDEAIGLLRENEQHLKDLSGLKHRLDVLDQIYTKVDKIAGEIIAYREKQQLNSKTLSSHDDRIDKLEKHAGFPRPTL